MLEVDVSLDSEKQAGALIVEEPEAMIEFKISIKLIWKFRSYQDICEGKTEIFEKRKKTKKKLKL